VQQCEQTLKGTTGILVVNEELAIVLQELSKRINGEVLPVPALAGFLAVSSGFGDQVGVVAAWRVDEGVMVSLAA
jgi:hypothetical protein